MTFHYDETTGQIVKEVIFMNGKKEQIRMNANKVAFRNKTIYIGGYPLFYPLSRKDWTFNWKFTDWEYECDQSDLFCPAWIRLNNQPKNTTLGEGVSVFIDDIMIHYRSIMGSLFIPWSQYNGIGQEDNWKSIEDSPEFKEIYWNKLSELYDIAYNKSNLKNKPYADEIEKFLNQNKVGKEASILSIGAGTGLMEEELAKRGFTNITLVDQSEKMLQAAKKKELLKDCKFICARAEDYCPDEKFDIILAFKTFCWVETKDILRLCLNNLKDNGYFITEDEIDYYFKRNPHMEPLSRMVSQEASSEFFKETGKELYIYRLPGILK
ncbi:class I SAM-dependent methyltransferase [Dolichospermum sp. ST_sed10]|nr:class I SAM-dependent methyltransferase [Dolichospermum sp. ST_sed10]